MDDELSHYQKKGKKVLKELYIEWAKEIWKYIDVLNQAFNETVHFDKYDNLIDKEFEDELTYFAKTKFVPIFEKRMAKLGIPSSSYLMNEDTKWQEIQDMEENYRETLYEYGVVPETSSLYDRVSNRLYRHYGYGQCWSYSVNVSNHGDKRDYDIAVKDAIKTEDDVVKALNSMDITLTKNPIYNTLNEAMADHASILYDWMHRHIWRKLNERTEDRS